MNAKDVPHLAKVRNIPVDDVFSSVAPGVIQIQKMGVLKGTQ